MQLTHIYRLSGLDRVLYASVPQWPEGSFANLSDTEGELTLIATGITTPESLVLAQADLDERAEKFRLAISYRIGCPLILKLHHADIPDVLPTGVMQAHATTDFSASATLTVLPSAPPEQLPQLPIDGARWIYTLAAIKRFEKFQEEVLKRLYLIIEELWPRFSEQATSEQRRIKQETKWLRDFVSHSECEHPGLVTFIATHVSSAVLQLNGKQVVRFDPTQIEHRNFIGRFEPDARQLTRCLVDQALAALREIE